MLQRNWILINALTYRLLRALCSMGFLKEDHNYRFHLPIEKVESPISGASLNGKLTDLVIHKGIPAQSISFYY